MPDSDNCESIDVQLRNLRSSISDLGYEVDSFKAKIAAALGLGVFLLLLSAGAAYDLFSTKQLVWQMLGVSREALTWITAIAGSVAIGLLLYGFLLMRGADSDARARLEQMEEQYAELVERQNSAAKKR